MSNSLHVLMVEDSEDDALLILRELRRNGFNVIWKRVETAEALRLALQNQHWDVLISDYNLPGFDAPLALEIVKQHRLNLPFIVVSGTIGETSAVEMMKAGAHDYLMKDKLARLSEAVRREIREAEIRKEQQQTTLELAQTKERLQLAIEGSGIGLWDWWVQTGAMTLNDRWAAILGYRLEDLEPISFETWRHHTHPEDLKQATRCLEQHFRHEIPVYECELRMRHQSGQWIWMLARGKVVEWDEAGNPLRMIGTNLDITDRKQSEAMLHQLNRELEERVERRTADLQQSEARLRAAQQVAHLGSWELDVDTQEITWSDEVFRIFGLKPDQAEPNYQQLLQTHFPADERDRLDDLIKRLIDSKEPYSVDLQIIRADGSSGYIFAKGETNLNAEGQVIRLFGIVMDISDRKQAEAQLQKANAELARSTRLKDEFLASMSHELRTPLTAILGMTDALQEENFGKLNDKQRNFLAVVEQSGRHLLSLINDILDLAKIESGTLELEPTPTLIPALCKASLSFVKQLALQKNIKLIINVPDQEMGEIYMDELRIKQALINLLNNAVKFTPSDGQVTLEVNYDQTQSLLQFHVIDTGIGIAAEDMPKLFQSFMQIDSRLNRQYNGTGLGLSLVKRIVELHQGSVTVESTPGIGSRFTISLPNCLVAKTRSLQPQISPTLPNDMVANPPFPQPQPSPEPSPEPSPGEPVTQATDSALILLVEDNTANIDTFSTYLISNGYRLIVATNGLEVANLVQQYHPDLILMDIQMPGMDGLSVTRQLRSLPDTSHIPIIALTALAMASDLDRCLEAGANAYFAKPVILKQLMLTIQSMLAAARSQP